MWAVSVFLKTMKMDDNDETIGNIRYLDKLTLIVDTREKNIINTFKIFVCFEKGIIIVIISINYVCLLGSSIKIYFSLKKNIYIPLESKFHEDEDFVLFTTLSLAPRSGPLRLIY